MESDPLTDHRRDEERLLRDCFPHNDTTFALPVEQMSEEPVFKTTKR